MTKNPSEKRPPQNVNDQEIEESYGNDYLRWKGWEGAAGFGGLTKTEAAYFNAELSRTGHAFPANSNVLEIGFGNGSFLKFAKDMHWDVSATEINEDLVTLASNCGYAATHTDNLSGFDNDTFDLIVAFDVLEHIPQDAIPDFLNQVKRTLKKGGFFLARFPNGDSPFGLINQNGDVTHITAIGSGKVRYFAGKCGMSVVFVGGEAQPLLGTTPLNFAHRLITWPIKMILNLLTNLIFFPRSNVAFYSSNLIAIYRKS